MDPGLDRFFVCRGLPFTKNGASKTVYVVKGEQGLESKMVRAGVGAPVELEHGEQAPFRQAGGGLSTALRSG
jgi:hypothetical protein